jgi:hypothetical protein
VGLTRCEAIVYLCLAARDIVTKDALMLASIQGEQMSLMPAQ